MGRFEKSFNFLQWQWLAAAVLDVFHENERRFESKKCLFKHKADIWSINSRMRTEVNQRSFARWCELTKRDHTYWPYSEDGVARMYFRIRKRQEWEVEIFDREVAEAVRKAELNGGRDLFEE
jgi:hypothetical protein